jgi:hypothetical protein
MMLNRVTDRLAFALLLVAVGLMPWPWASVGVPPRRCLCA